MKQPKSVKMFYKWCAESRPLHCCQEISSKHISPPSPTRIWFLSIVFSCWLRKWHATKPLSDMCNHLWFRLLDKHWRRRPGRTGIEVMLRKSDWYDTLMWDIRVVPCCSMLFHGVVYLQGFPGLRMQVSSHGIIVAQFHTVPSLSNPKLKLSDSSFSLRWAMLS